MYGSKSWTMKKAECWRTDAFKLWCWRRLLRVPWAARRSNQSILKEINPEYSLEGLMLNLQCFGHLMWRADSLENNLMLGKIDGRRRRGRQRMRWLDGIIDSMNMSVSKHQEVGKDTKPGMLQSMWSQRVEDDNNNKAWPMETTHSPLPKALPVNLCSKRKHVSPAFWTSYRAILQHFNYAGIYEQ